MVSARFLSILVSVLALSVVTGSEAAEDLTGAFSGKLKTGIYSGNGTWTLTIGTTEVTLDLDYDAKGRLTGSASAGGSSFPVIAVVKFRKTVLTFTVKSADRRRAKLRAKGVVDGPAGTLSGTGSLVFEEGGVDEASSAITGTIPAGSTDTMYVHIIVTRHEGRALEAAATVIAPSGGEFSAPCSGKVKAGKGYEKITMATTPRFLKVKGFVQGAVLDCTMSTKIPGFKVKKQPITLAQGGAPCIVSVVPAGDSVTARGWFGQASVTAPSDCGWIATSNDDWISISSGAIGVGDGEVLYSVAENPETDSRTGSMTIGGHHFVVTQLGSDAQAYSYDFEPGIGAWYADNGVWQVGIPTSGPQEAHSGEILAATILDGDHPSDTDSRFISPSIRLPRISETEEIHFRFMHWFWFGWCDQGFVQISVLDDATGEWSGWTELDGPFRDDSPAWTLMDTDLSDYAGRRVRVALYHTATSSTWPTNCNWAGPGWYVDDVEIRVFP
jgi:hypothetical protein